MQCRESQTRLFKACCEKGFGVLRLESYPESFGLLCLWWLVGSLGSGQCHPFTSSLGRDAHKVPPHSIYIFSNVFSHSNSKSKLWNSHLQCFWKWKSTSPEDSQNFFALFSPQTIDWRQSTECNPPNDMCLRIVFRITQGGSSQLFLIGKEGKR